MPRIQLSSWEDLSAIIDKNRGIVNLALTYTSMVQPIGAKHEQLRLF